MPLSIKQQRLVEQNIGLVGKVIKDKVRDVHKIGVFTYDDIFQIGCLGLSKAALHFTPGTAKFSTYAYISIRNEIFDALEYATIRREREVIVESAYARESRSSFDSVAEACSDLGEIIEKSKSSANKTVSKGLDVIVMMAEGHTAREIGAVMGGVPANHVTAWASKLDVLPTLMKIHHIARMVGNYDGSGNFLMADKIAGTTTAAMGFIKNGQYYYPNSALKADVKTISEKPFLKVSAVFIKDNDEEKYSNMTYLAKGMDIPEIIKRSDVCDKVIVPPPPESG